ncbi:hypothetical protein CCHOA_09740 [Corynebacterium choanae]|uniref:Uncharacterized protein n=1 Tax=Corynebacterium choanae TaxID=1862358 RepID=A0A3G6J895_9CORY|nr:hypothetical protein CCHOA_09740 [Corynebacterium choanae]
MIPGRLDAPIIAATVGILFAAVIAFKELPYTLTTLSDVLRVLGKYRWLRNYSRRCQDQQPAAGITHVAGGDAACHPQQAQIWETRESFEMTCRVGCVTRNQREQSGCAPRAQECTTQTTSCRIKASAVVPVSADRLPSFSHYF